MIAITIPAYNEEKTIGAVISGIRKAMRGSRFRVLVVDDGSTDGTAEAARKAGTQAPAAGG